MTKRVTSKATYQARTFLLVSGEVFPYDATHFDRAAHKPGPLLQVEKGQSFDVLGKLENGQVFVQVERDGQPYACLLLADSFL